MNIETYQNRLRTLMAAHIQRSKATVVQYKEDFGALFAVAKKSDLDDDLLEAVTQYETNRLVGLFDDLKVSKPKAGI